MRLLQLSALSKIFDVTDNFGISVPVSIGLALDKFYTNKSGYGFVSVGIQNSCAINANSSYNFNVSYYNANRKVMGGVDSSFLTYNVGITLKY